MVNKDNFNTFFVIGLIGSWFIHPSVTGIIFLPLFIFIIFRYVSEVSFTPNEEYKSRKQINFEPTPQDFEDLLKDNMYMSEEKKAAYLKSPQWQKHRLDTFTKDNFKCVTCGSSHKLNCHHITYERLGDENPEDLTTLCESCHNELHESLGYDRFGKYTPKKKTIEIKVKV